MRLIKTGTKRGNWLVTILLLMTMAAGVGLIAYPSFSEYWNSVHQSNVVMSYAENVAKINTEKYEGILNEARRYNAELAERGLNLVLSKEEKKEYLSKITGVALGSDAFFPFGDNIERARRSGVSYIAQPGGSIRDDNVIEACNKYDMAMVFTKMRLFHH